MQLREDAASAEWIGQVIDDRYRILEVLGEGGMGAVFVAEHMTLHKEVALKIVRPQFAGNRDLAARFAREAMVTSRIDHPNVISAIDYGTLPNGVAYLTMELVRGCSLNALLEREGSLHWGRAADLGAQLADALAAAAVHGIVHRDLKPENVLIRQRTDGSDQVKVLDFGIAKYTRDSLAPPALRGAQQVTEIGVVIGTPGYMAPEQAIGRRADNRADLYSLGVLLWEMVVGRRLWEGETTQDIIRSQLRDHPPSPRATIGDDAIPLTFDQIVLQLLANAPSQRPADAALVRDALRELVVAAKRGGGARDKIDTAFRAFAKSAGQPRVGNENPTRVDRRSPAPAASHTPLTGTTLSPRRRRRMSLVGALALLVVAGASALVLTDQLELKPKGDLHRITAQLGPGARAAEPPAEPEAAAPEPEPEVGATGLPPALEPTFQTMVQSESRTDRATAARALLGHIPVDEVPGYVRTLAHFQLAKTCNAKRRALSRIAEAEDPRALPALAMTSERGKSGCGRRGNRDCLSCLRKPLDKLIKKLEDDQLEARGQGE